MITHRHREIGRLKDSLLELSAEVEKSILNASRALADLNDDLASEVIANDNRINELEVDIEEDSLKILALYQPVAHDLRSVIAVLKINNDLERMGDLAVNICRYTKMIKEEGSVKVSDRFSPMFTFCLEMVRKAIDSFLKEDVLLAAEVCEADSRVDNLNTEIIKEIQEEIKTPGANVECLLYHMSICRTVERIADYATNIAEDVYYMVSGRIIRHQHQLT